MTDRNKLHKLPNGLWTFDQPFRPRARPTDTDFRREKLRDTIHTIVAVLLFLLFIFFLVDGFNDIPVKDYTP